MIFSIMEELYNMYRVIIVDDEPLVIKSLRKTINWAELGFEVIGESYNGIDAYEQILNLRPDLIFVDIRMPGMTGLELIKKLRDLSLKIQIIIISGYAEFAYAQKAINYGVLGFCLKPFDDDEITGLLKKAKSILDNSENIFEKEIVKLIEKSIYEKNEKEVEESVESFSQKWNISEETLVIVSFGSDKLAFPPDIRYFSFKLGANKYAYLITKDTHNKASMEEIKNNLTYSIKASIKKNDRIKSVGIGKIILSLKDIKSAIEDANIATYQFFMTGNKDVYVIDSINNYKINDLLKDLNEVLICKDLNIIKSVMDKIIADFKNGAYNITHAFTVYNYIISNFYDMGLESDLSHIYSFEQLLELFHTAEDMLEYFKELLIINLDNDMQYMQKEIKNENFKAILQYVNKNFTSDISLQNISKKFTINPSYASQLFKKELNMTFTEYLTKMRISYACKLLDRMDMSIDAVAEKSGYNDYFYFIKSFKKVVGVTPRQYRESIMRG